MFCFSSFASFINQERFLIRPFKKKVLLIILFGWGTLSPIKAETFTIYAAASTINVLQEVIQHYQQENSVKIRTSFASSGTLAKQIVQGAPAHIFISANPRWMDYLEEQQLLVPQSRFNWLSNRLVVITPKDQPISLAWETIDFPQAFEGRFSMGDPNHVPAGIYAREALEHFNWWTSLRPRAIKAHNVRSALVYVERGEVAMGIVYATDAKISKHVKIVAVFPENSHAPIVYPLALIADNENPLARKFIDFLQSSEAQEIYERHGFGVE